VALVVCVVVIALLSASRLVQRSMPSESLFAFGAALVGVLLLFELDRLG
jgi:hypothetical protein